MRGRKAKRDVWSLDDMSACTPKAMPGMRLAVLGIVPRKVFRTAAYGWCLVGEIGERKGANSRMAVCLTSKEKDHIKMFLSKKPLIADGKFGPHVLRDRGGKRLPIICDNLWYYDEAFPDMPLNF